MTTDHHPSDLLNGTACYCARYRPVYHEPFIRHVVERFQLDGQGRVLDLRCGIGQLTLLLARHCEEIVGLDPDPEMLAKLRRRWRQRAGLRHQGCCPNGQNGCNGACTTVAAFLAVTAKLGRLNLAHSRQRCTASK